MDKKQVILKQLENKRIGRSGGEKAGAIGGAIVGGLLILSGFGAPAGAILTGWAAVSFMASAATLGAAIGGLIDPPKPLDFGDATGYGASSPTYSFGALTHTITNQLPLAIVYGRVKLAGNVIWQSDPGATISRVQCLCVGEVHAITDIRVNEITLAEGTQQVTHTALSKVHNHDGHNVIYIPPHKVDSDFVLKVAGGGRPRYDSWVFDYGKNYCYWTNSNDLDRTVREFGATFYGDYKVATMTGCSVTAYRGTIDQTVDARVPSGAVNGLKRVANLAYTLQTGDKLKGGNPIVTAVVFGLKVRTWDSSTNAWHSYREYSNNPAACIRDFLTNDIYGAGIPESWIDDASFGNVFENCATLIHNNDGSVEERFQLDFTTDIRRPSLDILSDMLATFGGFLTVCGEKIKLRMERANEVAAQAFTMDNIVAGSFGYSKFSKDDLPNRVDVQYIDPYQEWVKVYARAEDKLDQDKREDLNLGRSIVEKKVALLGITRFSQASRIAKRYLYLAEYCPTLCGFKAGIDSVFCEVGDIISVSHDVPGWTKKLFRVLSIQEDEKDIMQLTCREYNSSIYDDGFGSAIETFNYGSVANAFAPVTDVSGLTISEAGYTDEDGTFVAEIDVSLTAPTDKTKEFLDSYIIELKKNGGNYLEVGRADGDATSYTIRPVEGGSTYYVRVKTVSTKNIISDGTTSSSLAVAGQSAEPGTVTSFSAIFTDEITLTWAANSEKDVINYEIRIADSNWGTLNNDFVWIGDSLKYTIVRPTARSGVTYYIKAKNRSGLYSTNAASTTPSNTAPAAPTLSSTTWFGFSTLDWTDTNDADLSHYELWQSDSNAWGGEETLTAKVKGTQFKVYGNQPVKVSGTAFSSTTAQDTGLTGTVDDQFNGDVLSQVTGTYRGQAAVIADYVSGTQTFTVGSWPDGTPTPGDFLMAKDRSYYKVGGVDSFGSGTLSSYEQIDFNPLTSDEIDMGTGSITQTEILDGSISTPKLAANAVTAAKITTGELLTLSAQIKDAIVTNAKIDTMAASKISAGTFTGGDFVVASGGAFKTDNYVAATSGARFDHQGLEINTGTLEGVAILNRILLYSMMSGKGN